MKNYYSLFVSLVLLITPIFINAQILSAGSGNWTSGSTWVGGVPPGSSDIAQIQDNHQVTVNGNITVSELRMNFASNSSGSACLLTVSTGNSLTVTNDFNILAPANSGRTCNVTVVGDLDIGGDLDLQFGSTLQNNTTVNIQVDGTVDITGAFTHASSASCTNNQINLDINTGAQFDCGNFTIDFNGTDSRFVADVDDNWNLGTLTGHLRKATSRFILNVNSGGDIDPSAINITSYSTMDNIIFNVASGGRIGSGTEQMFIDARGSNSNITVNNSGTFFLGQNTYLIRESTDTLDFNLNTGSTYYLNGVLRLRGFGSFKNYVDMDQAQNSVLRCFPYIDLETSGNGNLDLDVDGTYSTGYFDCDFRNNSTVNMTFGSNSVVVTPSVSINESSGNSTVNVTFNGTFTTTGNIGLTARANSQYNVNVNSSTSVGGNYTQRTVGSGAGIATDISGTLAVTNLVVDVTSGATGSDNTVDFDNSGAILQVERIDDTFDGIITSGTTNNSTFIYSGSGSGDSILTRPNISYDNLTINKSAGIVLNGTLDASNFNGDLTINGAGSMLLAGTSSLTVSGDLTNNGILNSQGNSFTLLGDFDNQGSYVSLSNDTLYFRGTGSSQSISGTNVFQHMLLDNSNGASIASGSVSIQNSVTLETGTLTTNGSLTFLSNSTNTGALAPVPASGAGISGTATVERFLNESASAFWYMIGTPTTGTTLADWNNELYMAGFPNSNNPGWGPTVYRFDNASISTNGDYTEGYTAPTDISNTVSNGQGWMVWVGSSPKTVNSVGTLNTGNTAVALDFNTNPALAAERGWNLVANPYPARVHWPSVGKTNVPTGEAFISRADGNYFAVVADGVFNINSSEAFWVQTTTGGGSLSFTESNKIMLPDSFNVRQQAPQYTKPLKMKLSYASNSTYEDYSVLRFGDASFSEEFDAIPGEASKVPNAYGTLPNIASYSVADQRNVYYNTLNPEDSNMIIPLKVWTTYPANQNETYTIDFENIITWSNDNHCIILRDSLNNRSQKIDDVQHDYSWTARDTNQQVYLYLEHSIPLQISSSDATCYGYADGSASVKGLDGLSHTYVWFDENDNILKRENGISTTSTMDNLPAGTYLVMVDNNGDCGIMGVTIEIGQPEPIIASFEASKDTLYMNSSTDVTFTNNSVNAVEYSWNFGDGNTSDAVDPSHTYSGAGSYEVQLVASDNPCSDTLSKTITVIDNVGIESEIQKKADIRIYQLNGEVFVEFDLNISMDAQINVYDIMGRKVIPGETVLNARDQKIRLNLPGNLNGVYTVNVNTDDSNVSEKLYLND